MNLSWKLLLVAVAIIAAAEARGGRRGGRGCRGKPCRWTDADGNQQTYSCEPSNYFTCQDLDEPKQTQEGETIQAVCKPLTCTSDNDCGQGQTCLFQRPQPTEDDRAMLERCLSKPPRRGRGDRGGSGGDDQDSEFPGGSFFSDDQDEEDNQRQGGNRRPGGFQSGGGNPRFRSRRFRRQADEGKCSVPVQAMLANKACNVNGQSNGPCPGNLGCNTTLACTVNFNSQDLSLYFCNRPDDANRQFGGNPPFGGNQPSGNNPNGNQSPLEPLTGDQQSENPGGQPQQGGQGPRRGGGGRRGNRRRGN